MQKAARKNTKYSRNETILNIGKNGFHAKAIYSLCKIITLGQKIKLRKTSKTNLHASTLHLFYAKNRPKKNYYSRNDTTLNTGKNDFHAIAFAKSSLWIKEIKIPKPYQKRTYKHILLFLCKKSLEKTPNIREMRPF